MVETIKAIFKDDTFDLHEDEVLSRNYKNFERFSIFCFIIAVVSFLFGWIVSRHFTFNTEAFLGLVYSLVLMVLCKKLLKNNNTHITLLSYIAITPPMLVAILMGTFFDTTQPSITIMVYICVLPLFIFDRCFRNLIYITATAVIYAICCYIAKDYNMFVADMIDLVLFYFMSIGINFFIRLERFDSVKSYVKLREKSETDLLMNIYNRGAGVEKIESCILQKIHGAFIIMDIDNFKDINDDFGHRAGDEVLQNVAKTLKSLIKENDIILRMGGDEIALYILGVENNKDCEEYCELIYQKMQLVELKSIKNKPIGLSIGGCVYNDDKTSFTQLYKNSDICLYKAKKEGKSRYCVFQENAIV